MTPQFPPPPAPQPVNSHVKTALASGALGALLIANVAMYVQIDRVRTEAATSRKQLEAEIESLKENTSTISTTSRKHLDTLREEVDAKNRMALMAASQAKAESLNRIEQSKKALEEAQRQESQKVSGEISEVKQAATTANAKIADVSGDASNLKTEVASTRTELQSTIANLKKVAGDLGETNGYVATNSKELAALKQLGERNYIEFNLSKTKSLQRVGDISLQLKKADPKRNKFSIDVLADDKKTEKKDRNINEPVQFYVAKARQPYEIVVNQVKKDQIVGYLATPKTTVARN